MGIGELYIPWGIAGQAKSAQQGSVAAPSANKVRPAPASTPKDSYRPAGDGIIDAEFVDLYSPIRRPPEQQQHWRQVLIEEEPPTDQTPSAANQREQLLMTRYEQNSLEAPLPGRYLNLIA